MAEKATMVFGRAVRLMPELRMRALMYSRARRSSVAPCQKSSPEIKALEAKIRSVGEKWKKLARGNKDFGDAYPELFR